MSGSDLRRYGVRYALLYVGLLVLTYVVVAVAATFYEFRVSDMSVGALIGAAMATYLRFLKDKVRLPTSREYWSLVAMSATIVLVIDFTLAALVIHFTRDYGFSGSTILIMIGLPLLKGVLGNMLFYRRGGFAERTLTDIRTKQPRLNPRPAEPSYKMTFGDAGPFLVRYFAAYIPLYVLTRYVSITAEAWGEQWLPPAITIAAAVCALSYVVRRLGRRPTRSEYGLLVIVSVIAATVFEFVGEMAIYYYRFSGVPNSRTLFFYMIGAVITSAIIHTIAYSRPVAWLVRPRTRSASDA